jgi:hypothetical protein
MSSQAAKQPAEQPAEPLSTAERKELAHTIGRALLFRLPPEVAPIVIQAAIRATSEGSPTDGDTILRRLYNELDADTFELLIDTAKQHPQILKLIARGLEAGEYSDLKLPPKHAKQSYSMEFTTDTPIMRVNAQTVIEQATAAQQVQPETPIHSAPDTPPTLAAIAAEAVHLHGVLSELRERDIPLTTAEAELAITGLHDIATRSRNTARQLGLHAVERGLISQNKLAQLLGVNQVTVSRWYHENNQAGPSPLLTRKSKEQQ